MSGTELAVVKGAVVDSLLIRPYAQLLVGHHSHI
jgi:hypothetical protein